MDLEFNKVTYDDELTDFSEDELRELVGEFETAQESNVAEFEKAAEVTEEIDESTIEDFEDARESLIEEIVEAEAFDSVPLTEDELAEKDFSDLREWRDFVQAQAEAEADDDEDDAQFDDMGQKAPTGGDDDESEEFVEEALGSMQGLSL